MGGAGPRAVQGAAVMYTAIVGNLFIALAPMFWGGYSEFLQFSDERIGDLMSGEFFGSTAATVAGISYMHLQRLDLRRVVYGALCVYVVGNYLTPYLFNSPHWLMATRVLCGLSAGTSYLAAATAITGLGSPPRLVAAFYGAPFVVGALFQPLMRPAFEQWGIGGAFDLIAIVTLAAAALYPYFPRFADHGGHVEEARDDVARSVLLVGILAGALLLQYIANAGIWLYFARIGELSGHAAQTVATIVGVGTGMALIGTWASAVLAGRMNAVHGILWGTAAIIMSSLALRFSSNLTVFATSVAVFNAMITFLTPFYFVLFVRIYRPARAVVIGNICMALGFSAGPLLIRYTVHDSDFSGSINATIGLFLASAALVLFFYALYLRRDLTAR